MIALRQSVGPADALIPLAAAAGVLLALWLIFRLLGRFRTLRGLAAPYAIGALVLALLVGLAAAGRPLNSTVDRLLEAVLVCAWGFVGLGLAENLLLDRWLGSQGVAVPQLMRDVARAVAFALAVLVSVRLVFPDVSLSSIVISSTVLSAVIGLALQDLLKNVFAGIALQMERPFDVGHWVEINGRTGRVTEMSWRATRVVTVDGNYIIYPNSMLAQTELNNFTIGSTLQAMHVQVNVGHEHPPGEIKRVLLDACFASEHVAREPAPSIKVHQYGDFFLVYDVKFWLANYDRYPEKRDSVMTSIWYHLSRAGVRLPQPVRHLYLREVDSQVEADERQAADERVADTLRQVDLFSVLEEDELRRLAASASPRLYGRDEVLVRQDDPGNAFFVLRSGRVRIEVRQQGNAVVVNRLGPGEFFGELSLLTGAPRGATVVADEDVEALVVTREAIAPLLKSNPELPERLGTVLAQRQEMTRAVLATRRHSDEPHDELSRPTLVRRIRSLFGLNGR